MLCPQLGYGGAEKSFVRLANFLCRHHEVTVALFASTYSDVYHQQGSETLEAPAVVLPGGDGRVRRWITRWRSFRSLKLGSDVAISFLSGPNLLNALTAKAIPAIISVRGSRQYDTEGSALWRFIWNRLLDVVSYRQAARIVTASAGLAGEVEEVRGRAFAGKVVPIEGTIDAAALIQAADAPFEPEFEVLTSFRTIVACGRLHEQKGFQYLIPIFAQVLAREPLAKLMIIGDGPELKKLLELGESVGLKTTCDVSKVDQSDILFAGYHDKPARFLRLGRVFAFTSLYEGLPNTLIEAVASGVPILAADCPWGARSVLAGHLDGGLLPEGMLPLRLPLGTLMPRLDSGSASDVWADKLVAALQVPLRRATKQDRRSAIRRFDMAATGRAWLAVVDSVIREREASKRRP